MPTVCAVMLTADRPEMAKRAVECFRAQTYPAKRLLILDSATHHATGLPWGEGNATSGDTTTVWTPDMNGKTVGELRNAANAESIGWGVWHLTQRAFVVPDILIHWDDDDYSHPERIAEQVALLQASNADAVGYREMLFWREGEPERYGAISDLEPARLGESWLYTSPDPRYCLGTSLCYWRTTWERKPFEPTSQGEDAAFVAGLSTVGIPAFGDSSHRNNPRMIARIHNGNTSNAYRPELMAMIERQGGEWRRAPEWDSYCRKVMER